MSNSALQRLEQLLSRVQLRRTEARLQAVPELAPPVSAAAEARSSLQTPDLPFSSPPPATGRVSKAPGLTPLEESMEQVVPVERPRETSPNAFEARGRAQPESEELVLDDFEPVSTPTMQPGAMSAPPVARAPAPVASMAPIAAPIAAAAPAVAPAPAAITAATARIAPVAPVSAAAPVAIVTKARSIEPKSFGDLLDLSLSLRPSK